jgi:hypothetical protein
MVKAHRTRTAALLLSLAVPTLCQPDIAHAFDTGPHHDMTRAAFQDEGFAPGSRVIEIAQVSNWLIDYYSNRPQFPAEFERLARELSHMHFDSLTGPEQIRNTWSRLALNTRSGVLAAAADVRSAPNPEERYRRLVHLAVLIGASLHPVQDFYSHSNWVQLHPMRVGVYGTHTWFDMPSSDPSLRTGLVGRDGGLYPSGDTAQDHGGYDAGMNQDSYSRPHWPRAYVYGYSASRQWLRAVRQWVEEVEPAIWQDLLTLELRASDATALALDLNVSYVVSLWTPFKGKDGAWKGRGSGDKSGFLTVGAGWMAFPNSIIVQRFREGAYEPLVLDMDKRSVAPDATPPQMPRFALGRRVVLVRTVRAAMLDGDPDLWGDADTYAVVTIAGQRYVEATQQEQNDISPRWLSIALVPTSSSVVPVIYELFDDDALWDDVIDIHPAAGRTRVEFGFDVHGHALSGDLRGVRDSADRTAVLQGGGGDDDPARVELYVTEHALEAPPAGAQAAAPLP